jgi:hypothetical protein
MTLHGTKDALSRELRMALDAFDAGSSPAGIAATHWLKTQALDSSLTSRTRLLVGAGRIAGFYALASAHVTLSQSDRRRLGRLRHESRPRLSHGLPRTSKRTSVARPCCFTPPPLLDRWPRCRRPRCSWLIPSTGRPRSCGASALGSGRRPSLRNVNGYGSRCRQANRCVLADRGRRDRYRPRPGTIARAGLRKLPRTRQHPRRRLSRLCGLSLGALFFDRASKLFLPSHPGVHRREA